MNTSEAASHETSTGSQPRPAAAPPYSVAPPSAIDGLRDPRTKSPGLAAVLSLMPGLGQVYIGYYPRGFINAVTIGGILSIVTSMRGDPPYLPFLVMFMVFYWLFNIIDAARLAALYNRALAGGREPALPEGFSLPGMGGSILGGTILVAAGFVVLLHTRWGVRLDWVGDWWPVFPMLFGVYLVVRAIKDRADRADSR